jgi:hypothetical protein
MLDNITAVFHLVPFVADCQLYLLL